MDVVCVVNESEIPLPSERQMTRKERARLSELQSRAHLRTEKHQYDAKRKQETLIRVLTDEERTEMDELARLKADLETVQIGDISYKFAPHGQKGSAWLMGLGHANIAVSMHPTRLRVLKDGERPLVAPLRYKHIPSAFEQTFGYATPEELAASPSFSKEVMTGPGLTVEDGVTVESIYPVTVPGERAGVAAARGREPEEVSLETL